MDCIFCKIVSGEIPSNKVYEDDKILAFHDIAPQMPVHIIVIPKIHIESALDINEENCEVVGHAFKAISKIAKEAGLDGVVCSPLEAGKVHDVCGKEFLTVTPGVRFAGGDVGDQSRITTPEGAKAIGSDYIVVGRPITAAADPVAAYERCVAEFVG